MIPYTLIHPPQTRQPGGLPAVSRGLSAATPPVGCDGNVPTPAGSQRALKHNVFINIQRNNCDPSRVGTLSPLSGGVAALNPRLMAKTPPGLNSSPGGLYLKNRHGNIGEDRTIITYDSMIP